MKKSNGATIYIFAMVLYNIIFGHQKHSHSGLVANSKLLRTMKVIGNEIYKRELGIFT
jgi:hypothetical protein